MPLFLHARVKFIRAESNARVIINVPPIYDASIDIYDASNTRILSESQRGSILLYCATIQSERTSQKLHFVLLIRLSGGQRASG